MLQLDDPLIVILFIAGISAPVASRLALGRQRHPVVWFGFGAVLGPIALGLLAAAPPGRCPACDEPISGWPGSCPRCSAALTGMGSWFRSSPARSLVPAAGLESNPQVSALDAALDRRARRPAASTARSRSSPSIDRPRSTRNQGPGARVSTGHEAGEVLSTGVYLSGDARLEIGACYALSRVGDRWRLFGPVDAGQITVRHEGSLAGLQVTGMDDRIILRDTDGRSDVAIVLRSVGGLRPDDLERVLAPDAASDHDGDDRPDPGARGMAS